MSDVIYFDHAATSWPKPTSVRDAINRYFGEAGGNPGRSGHRMSIEAARAIEECRDSLAECLGIADPARIVLTKNATEALNLAIYGRIRPGDHVVTSSIEHNSVMRPLRHLESMGASLTVVPCAANGMIDAEKVAAAINPQTRLVVTVHGSNVMGTVLPIAQIAQIARHHGAPYLVDASQTAGAIPIDVQALGIDMLAFTGHKALLGPTGTGGLYIRDGLTLEPLMRGGTGSRSDMEVQPEFLPDAYESGTLNVAGFVGLAAGVRYVLDKGFETIMAHERALVDRFLTGAADISGVIVYGPPDLKDRCGVISFNVSGMPCSDVGMLLDRDYGVLSRVGLHCSPGAHHTVGTFPGGTVRFGLGYSNTEAEIDIALGAIRDIAAWAVTRTDTDER
jgi:cysteine desulfurase family protein